jgi:hypothetical protein
MDLAHKTAIKRKTPSRPARILRAMDLIKYPALDYGCGYGKDAEWLGCNGYDPYYHPTFAKRNYKTILCTYVLNVIECEHARREILHDIDGLLHHDGCAYISVRTNKNNLKGLSKRGTWRGRIILDLPIVYRCSGLIICCLRKGESNCRMKAVIY